MNSIFFGVSDIGISTVVQQAAFYQLITQGLFYLIVPVGTFIDWWIITRETVFFLIYLGIMSAFLYGNKVTTLKAFFLLMIYVIHIFLMKFSSKYEVSIKHNLANSLEINELKKLANQDISRFHRTLKSQAISIEMLNKVNFRFLDGYIVFEDSLIRRKITPIASVKLGEEQFAERDDKALHARLNLKRAVTKIIIRL